MTVRLCITQSDHSHNTAASMNGGRAMTDASRGDDLLSAGKYTIAIPTKSVTISIGLSAAAKPSTSQDHADPLAR